MKNQIFISYFYQLRFFKENMIPFSTVLYDPKWLVKDSIYRDKRGIVIGLKAENFVAKIKYNGVCKGRKLCKDDPKQCNFMKNYRAQLSLLDPQEEIRKIYDIAEKYNQTDKNTMPVLIVYETPNNKCSEREVIIDFFNDAGINCSELSHPIEENY